MICGIIIQKTDEDNRTVQKINQENRVFEEYSIPKAVMTLAVPTIITQLINIVYNLADTWYVGRTGNPGMVAALSVCMPVYVIMAAIANLFGVGGASVISRNLGMKRPERAKKVFAFCFYTGLGAAIVYAVLIYFLRPWLIPIVGGDDSSYSYIEDYMFWTMVVGAIPNVGNVLCGHLVRSIGAAKQAGFGMSLGGILNIILDPLFMFVILPEGMEVTGAALATMLSNTAALIYFLIFIVRHKEKQVLTLSVKDYSVKDKIPSDVLSIGIPAALSTTLAMVSNMFANSLISEYSTAAVAGMGVAKKINSLAFNTCMGLTQGVLPLVGYCYGAKNYHRMNKVIRFTAALALGFGTFCTLMFEIFAAPLVTFFIDEEASVYYGAQFLSVIAFAAPTTAFTYMVNTVFQATGRRYQSFLLSILRKGLLDIPAMFVFKSFLGAVGVVWATPFAEAGSILVSAGMLIYFMKKIKRETIHQNN